MVTRSAATTPISFTSGVASVSGGMNGVMTLYKAEAANITVTDGSIDNSAGPLSVTVDPGPLNHFTWTDQPNASQTAGDQFDSVEVTAYDQWDNVKTNYDPAGAVFSGLNPAGSPNGDCPLTASRGPAASPRARVWSTRRRRRRN